MVTNLLDFTGKAIQTTSTHLKGVNPLITIVDTFTYDQAGRVLTQKQSINNAVQEVIVSNNYDSLGQLTSKGVGGKTTQNRLQTVDYAYNIRGWLKGINDVNTIGNDLFSFKINYNNPTDPSKALYNGNISQTFWKTTSLNTTSNPVSSNYTYTYDALNRLTSGVDNTTNYIEALTYDKNGNIMSLFRKGNTNLAATTFGTMDNLVYTYNNSNTGNRLMKVADSGNTTEGFKDGNNTGDDYTYDANGNMKTDANKGINSIAYNHLNLPTQVVLVGGFINYVYDATGAKQRKIVGTTTTDYAGGFQYENNNLKFFSTPEGYVDYNSGIYSYIYQYKDHLGNVRLSYGDPNNDGTITTSEIIEESNYYPFGLKHKGYNIAATSTNPAQKYKYNGKELQDELGLNMYDYGARNYDPSLGRWMNADPLAEQSRRWSPYNYAYNNPIYFVDPDGMQTESYIKADSEIEDRLAASNKKFAQWVNSGGNSPNDSPPDDITVGANGRVTNVVRNDKPNRFFDENGVQIKVNDPKNDNQFLETQDFNVGDQIFTPISMKKLVEFIMKAGLIPSAMSADSRYLTAAIKSHTTADFGFNVLSKAYNESPAGAEYGGNIGNGTFYRFGNQHTVYNLGDAGNFMWGAWMSASNFLIRR